MYHRLKIVQEDGFKEVSVFFSCFFSKLNVAKVEERSLAKKLLAS